MRRSPLRFILWIVFLSIGFFAGLAWKNAENPIEKVDTSSNEEVLTKENEEKAEESNEASRTITYASKLTASESATIQLFENAAPSVCYITTSNVRMDFFTRNVTEIPSGTGSGFVWDASGHIVTNYHVIKSADRAQITLADRSSWPAKLVGAAPEKDLAILKIEAPTDILQPIPLGTSDDLKVGQNVYAIGNPFGLDQTLTTGIVSALGREIETEGGVPIRDVIQTDAAINPGNSGGPLLDSSGRLIGVNTAIYSPSGASAGIGFSIPVDVVSWVVPELITFGEIKRPILGVEIATSQVTNRLGLEGALVLYVQENSPAERVGIRPTVRDRSGAIRLGDLIIAIDEIPIKNGNDLVLALEKYEAGNIITVSIMRENEKKQVELSLDSAQ
ncbi:MAG: trypsin-like serine protease [Bacteroidetes bacterium]|nr:trypsin-like serine protease [Bacteroidota bacterium]